MPTTGSHKMNPEAFAARHPRAFLIDTRESAEYSAVLTGETRA